MYYAARYLVSITGCKLYAKSHGWHNWFVFKSFRREHIGFVDFLYSLFIIKQHSKQNLNIFGMYWFPKNFKYILCDSKGNLHNFWTKFTSLIKVKFKYSLCALWMFMVLFFFSNLCRHSESNLKTFFNSDKVKGFF